VAWIVLALAAAGACRRTRSAPPLVADVSGRREVAGLSAPVRVVRDRFGVPHIYAENRDDLFFAQGFIAAQDRLFQMDLWRRWALGRLSEVLGPNFAERDAMTRRIQYSGSIETEWTSYATDTRAIASAFVRGVNAWVALARERPPEEFVLAGWLPEPWSAEDLLNRTDAFAASGDAIDEIFRARLVAAIGVRRAAELLATPIAVPPDLDPALVGSAVGDAIRSVGAPPFFLGLAAQPQTAARPGASDGESSRGDIPLDVRTMPLPSPRYLVHLHAPGWNVIGAAAPWLPGVSEGHNDRVAWRIEPVDVDAQDVFVERVNPSNPHQVEDRGQWVDTLLTKDPLAIRRRDKPLVFDRERTGHGAILAVDRERHLAFTLRWAGAEPGGAGDLLALEIDRAATAADVSAALARWTSPARRVAYADVAGHSASEIAARVPLRRGWTGALPAPGWSGANDWIGWRRPDTADTYPPLRLLARRLPDRADVLLRDLQRAAGRPDAASTMRAILVNAVADALRDDGAPRSAVLFAHPLAITEATRRRFNIGPIRPGTASPLFEITGEVASWDRSTAMNAPGQSGSPSTVHYGDLARVWREGQTIPLAFTDRAVSEAAESTLTLAPLRESPSR
jgi:acyl-homoserine lactone acylase PvdQ